MTAPRSRPRAPAQVPGALPVPEPPGYDDLADALSAVHALLLMTPDERRATTLPDLPPGSPTARVAAAFGLSPFERAVLLLAALLELQPGVDTEFAVLGGSDQRPWPTLGLALSVLPGADWAALLPTAPLRAERLIRLGAGEVLTNRAVLVEERVLHALMGVDYLEPRLAHRLVDLPEPPALAAGHAELARRLAGVWGRPAHLWCESVADGLAVAAVAAGGRRALRLPAGAAPTDPEELDEFLALWSRESRLQPLCLVVDLDDTTDPAALRAAVEVARRATGPVVGCGPDPRAGERLARLRVAPAPFAERLDQWTTVLRGAGRPAPPELPDLVARFRLDAVTLGSVVDGVVDEVVDGVVGGVDGGVDGEVVGEVHGAPGDAAGSATGDLDLGRRLWDGARVQAHPRLEDLAQRLPTRAGWTELVLPPEPTAALRALTGQVRAAATVDHVWGFARDGARGGGAAAVFTGPSGTGKTMAAEVIAAQLRLDLFRIDLSAVVSKYIGETEKNLRRVFDAAESGGAVLLFDEADALFGKRTEVRDSHDRHANIEVSYLLQRMESYSGLAVLTTNFRDHLDPAFLRRIPFVVDFPFPDVDQRERIWRRIFPADAPVEDVDPRRLAKLSVAGGSIRSIARNAAFLAADAGTPITMTQLRAAAELEYRKLGRTLTPGEVRGWS